MELWFDDNEIHEVYVSHTKVKLPSNKKEYEFENIRLRTLKGINNLNLLLTIHIGHMNKLAEEMD